jgi:hypothetical protein
MSGARDTTDWPPTWELTAPESHVLEHRGGANGDVPFRLAVTELVARSTLSAQPTKGRLLSRPSFVVTDGSRIEDAVAPVLEPVRDAYRETSPRTVKASDGSTVSGVLMRDLLETFGASDEYLDLHVRPALVARGLLEQTERRGFSSRPDFDWTDAGRDADRALADWLERIREYLSSRHGPDSGDGKELMARAGSAVLLVDGFHRELAALAAPAFVGYVDPGIFPGVGSDFGGGGGGDGGGC